MVNDVILTHIMSQLSCRYCGKSYKYQARLITHESTLCSGRNPSGALFAKNHQSFTLISSTVNAPDNLTSNILNDFNISTTRLDSSTISEADSDNEPSTLLNTGFFALSSNSLICGINCNHFPSK